MTQLGALPGNYFTLQLVALILKETDCVIFVFPEIYFVAVPWCQKSKYLNSENATNVHCCKPWKIADISLAVSVTSQSVALPFQKADIANEKAVTLTHSRMVLLLREWRPDLWCCMSFSFTWNTLLSSVWKGKCLQEWDRETEGADASPVTEYCLIVPRGLGVFGVCFKPEVTVPIMLKSWPLMLLVRWSCGVVSLKFWVVL